MEDTSKLQESINDLQGSMWRFGNIVIDLKEQVTKLEQRIKKFENSNKLYQNTDGTGYRG